MHTSEESFLNDFELISDELFRFIFFQTKNRDVAVDLTQDCFVEVWKYIAAGNRVENIRAFCYTVVKRRIIDYRRRKKDVSLDTTFNKDTQIDIDYISRTFNNHEASSLEKLSEQERDAKIIEVVTTSLLELQENDRKLIQLRCIEELSVAKISELLDIPASTLSVQIFRARDRLKKILDSKGVYSEFLNEYE